MSMKFYKRYFIAICLFIFNFYCFSAPAKPMNKKGDSDVEKAERLDVEKADKIDEKYCSLVIESNVYNAEVYINGIFKGYTKLELNKMRPGLYFIEVVKNGYERERFEVFLRRGDSKDVYVTLKLITGYIEFLNYPKGASVYVDGSLCKDKIVEVPIGRRLVVVRKFGYEKLETYVDVYPYETSGVSIELNPAEFYLADFEVSEDRINPLVNGLCNCKISFYVNANEPVTIKIIAENGDVVKQFDFARFTTWNNSVEWNGTDSFGNPVADGNYKIVIESKNYKFEESIIVDSTMKYPVESFTCCGGGIGNYPTVFNSTKRTVRPSFGAEGIFVIGKEKSGAYGCHLETGVLFDIGKYVEVGIAVGGLMGSYKSDKGDTIFPFNLNTSVKVSNSIKMSDSFALGFGGFITYGYSNYFIEPKLNKGFGFGGILGLELPLLYAGISSEFVIGAETGDFVKDSKIWKNAVSLSFSPVDFMRLSGWCGVNNFDSLDCGLGYTVVPGAGGLTLDLSANVLLFFDYKTYVSGKLVLSYSI